MCVIQVIQISILQKLMKQNRSQIIRAIFVIGPSGSGKSSLASHLSQLYGGVFGKQATILCNLDAANYHSQGQSISITELITIQDVMEEYEIGPNGSLIYTMEFLGMNLQWLFSAIDAKIKPNAEQVTLIFDMPGQVQLYLSSPSVKEIISRINKKYQASACILQLFDSTYIHNANHYVSLCMMSLCTIINFELPHISLLNKVDLWKGAQERPSRGLINEYFGGYASQILNETKPFDAPEETIMDGIAKVIQTYGQVSFLPCSIYKAELISTLLLQLEKVFGTLEISLLNQNFTKLTAECTDMFMKERALTALENQLDEDQEELERMNKQMQS